MIAMYIVHQLMHNPTQWFLCRNQLKTMIECPLLVIVSSKLVFITEPAVDQLRKAKSTIYLPSCALIEFIKCGKEQTCHTASDPQSALNWRAVSLQGQQHTAE